MCVTSHMCRFYAWFHMCRSYLGYMCITNHMCRFYAWFYTCRSFVDSPPDPIYHLCSLTGNWISQNYFTYRSIQIFKILSRGFYSQKSDSPHKIMWYCVYYSTNLASLFPPGRNLPGENDLYHSCTSIEGASWRGQPLNIFTWFIGSGGCVPRAVNVDSMRGSTCFDHMWVICVSRVICVDSMRDSRCVDHMWIICVSRVICVN